jgi:hypothetical protein
MAGNRVGTRIESLIGAGEWKPDVTARMRKLEAAMG